MHVLYKSYVVSALGSRLVWRTDTLGWLVSPGRFGRAAATLAVPVAVGCGRETFQRLLLASSEQRTRLARDKSVIVPVASGSTWGKRPRAKQPTVINGTAQHLPFCQIVQFHL